MSVATLFRTAADEPTSSLQTWQMRPHGAVLNAPCADVCHLPIRLGVSASFESREVIRSMLSYDKRASNSVTSTARRYLSSCPTKPQALRATCARDTVCTIYPYFLVSHANHYNPSPLCPFAATIVHHLHMYALMMVAVHQDNRLSKAPATEKP